VAKDRIDRDEEDLVRLYLTDIGQYALLTKDDEVRLAKAIETGKQATAELETNDKTITPNRRRALRKDQRDGTKAERQFVQSNLRLVVSIAKKYQASGLPLLDLIQEGNLGLMHAVEKFDWRKGFKFCRFVLGPNVFKFRLYIPFCYFFTCLALQMQGGHEPIRRNKRQIIAIL
jgi:DNA-directed RNA polymerase sigma subunit (sigma70/sigma32)